MRSAALVELASAFAFRAEYTHAPDELMTALAELIVQHVGFDFVAIDIEPPAGTETGLLPNSVRVGGGAGKRFECPITYQGLPIGRLQVGDSARRLSRRRRREVLAIARYTGGVIHAARLLAELRASLDRVLYAREDERRRLRHELHDSLGPILAGISLGLHAVRRLMDSDPDQARQTVGHLEDELQAAIGEVRRLFEALRPPVLDQVGLVAAVREHMEILSARLNRDEGPTTDVSFDLRHEGDFTTIPAIVEVAAYRIVCEALTNVARHAAARSCTVTLRKDHQVHIEVVDDGVGIAHRSGRGLGLQSMRERAVELGGSLAVESPAGRGTTVSAVLPVNLAPAAANVSPGRVTKDGG